LVPKEDESVPVKLRVLILDPPTEALSRVARAVDTQSLSYDSFEVCYLLDGPEKHLHDRLDALRAHRPNVRLSAGERGQLADLARECLQGAEADYVLAVPGTTELHPEALARLVELADQSGSEVVEGRASGVGPSLLLTQSGLATKVIAAVEGRPAAADWVQAWSDGVRTASPRVAALDSYPISRGTNELDRVRAIRDARATWDGPLLVFSCRLPEELQADEATFFVRSLSTGLEFRLATQPVDGNEPDRREGWVDLATAAAGAALPGGEWEVGLESRGEALVRLPLPNVPISSAIVRGRPVVRTLRGPQCRLQVDRIRRNLVHANPALARIEESARGTRLELPLQDLHVAETESLDGRLMLGQLPIAATIRVVDGQASLETWLSGLAGSYVLASDFGNNSPAPTGLSVQVDGVGAMTLDRLRAGPAKGADDPPVLDEPSWGQALMRRVRRRVPDRVAKLLGRRR